MTEEIVEIKNPKLTSDMAKAISEAVFAIEAVTKDANNPHFNSRYADLASIIEAVKKPLHDNGLCFLQKIITVAGGVGVETVLIFKTGETYSCGVLELPVERASAQGYGSALTYARRYGLSMALGVPQIDDDGNTASHTPEAPHRAPAAPVAAKSVQSNPDKVVLLQGGSSDGKPRAESGPFAHYKYCYNLPYKSKTMNMDTVRASIKARGARFNPEDKHWYSNELFADFSAFLMGGNAEQIPLAQPKTDAQVVEDVFQGDDTPWNLNEDAEPNV